MNSFIALIFAFFTFLHTPLALATAGDERATALMSESVQERFTALKGASAQLGCSDAFSAVVDSVNKGKILKYGNQISPLGGYRSFTPEYLMLSLIDEVKQVQQIYIDASKFNLSKKIGAAQASNRLVGADNRGNSNQLNITEFFLKNVDKYMACMHTGFAGIPSDQTTVLDFFAKVRDMGCENHFNLVAERFPPSMLYLVVATLKNKFEQRSEGDRIPDTRQSYLRPLMSSWMTDTLLLEGDHSYFSFGSEPSGIALFDALETGVRSTEVYRRVAGDWNALTFKDPKAVPIKLLNKMKGDNDTANLWSCLFWSRDKDRLNLSTDVGITIQGARSYQGGKLGVLKDGVLIEGLVPWVVCKPNINDQSLNLDCQPIGTCAMDNFTSAGRFKRDRKKECIRRSGIAYE